MVEQAHYKRLSKGFQTLSGISLGKTFSGVVGLRLLNSFFLMRFDIPRDEMIPLEDIGKLLQNLLHLAPSNGD